MKSRVLFTLLLAFITLNVHSQYEATESSVAWHESPSGISAQTEVGYLFLSEKGDTDTNRGLSIRQHFGYELSAIANLGLGLGYDQYENQNILPLYVDLRGDFITGQKFTPFYFGQAGLGVSITADDTDETIGEDFSYDGGLYYALGGGLKIRTQENISWIVSLGYISQNHSRIRSFTSPNNGNLGVTEEYSDNRIGFRVGFVF